MPPGLRGDGEPLSPPPGAGRSASLWDRQASIVPLLVFAAICRMIYCLENVIFRGRGVPRGMTVVSPRAIVKAKAKHWVSGMP